jgi:hypothetical protein
VSRSTFFAGGEGLAQELDEIGHGTCRVLEEVPNDSVIATDASWECNRLSDKCCAMLTVQMRDSSHPFQGKVIDYEIVERTVVSRERNYSGSSQRMEVEAVKACIEHLAGILVSGRTCMMIKTLECASCLQNRAIW